MPEQDAPFFEFKAEHNLPFGARRVEYRVNEPSHWTGGILLTRRTILQNWERGALTFLNNFTDLQRPNALRTDIVWTQDEHLYRIGQLNQLAFRSTSHRVRDARRALNLGEATNPSESEITWKFNQDELLRLFIGAFALSDAFAGKKMPIKHPKGTRM